MNKYKYILIEHNFIRKELRIVDEYDNKYNCLQAVQEFAERFIKNKVGEKKINYYLNDEHNREYGYFIEKNLFNNNSLTVKYKYIKNKGWLWNDVAVDNIVSFYFIESNNNKNVEYHNSHEIKTVEQYFFELKKNDNFNDYNKCLQEIKNKINLIE